MRFPFIPRTLQPDLAGLIWFGPATANLNCKCKAHQMPSGNSHYYLVTKLNTDATSGTRQLHCYVVKFRFTSLYGNRQIDLDFAPGSDVSFSYGLHNFKQNNLKT